jgi:hypothetical protein
MAARIRGIITLRALQRVLVLLLRTVVLLLRTFVGNIVLDVPLLSANRGIVLLRRFDAPRDYRMRFPRGVTFFSRKKVTKNRAKGRYLPLESL